MALRRTSALARTANILGTLQQAPLAPSSPLLDTASQGSQTLQQHTSSIRMASTSAPRTYEWLAVIPDKPGMQAKRLEVRPQHFEGLTKGKESGLLKMGGAVLEDIPVDDEVSSMKFAGSTIVMVAESKQAVLDVLKEDVYVKAGVWDLEKAMIWPTKIAFRFP